ncbi:hypothetical protein I4U23_012168 [Adineta vaga]|nr:hypothetical protein I4U23_012168 [Adineta vaga]
MINSSQRPHSIYIPLHKNVCFNTGFDSVYPTDLVGIIGPVEFLDSLDRINHPVLSNKKKFYYICIFFLVLVTFGICFIIGAQTTTKDTSLNTVLLNIGMLSAHVGLWSSCCACFMIKFRRDRKFLQAVTKESIKYSCRSSTSCTWRLVANEGPNDFGHLVIDIGHSTIVNGAIHHSNQVAPDSILTFEQQDDSQPPLYSDLFPRFCSQCNALRSNLTVNFCSLCGHSFSK